MVEALLFAASEPLDREGAVNIACPKARMCQDFWQRFNIFMRSAA